MRKSGNNYGLRLTLNVNAAEYIGMLAQSSGVRIMVHNENQQPDIDQALFVAPGEVRSPCLCDCVTANDDRHQAQGLPAPARAVHVAVHEHAARRVPDVHRGRREHGLLAAVVPPGVPRPHHVQHVRLRAAVVARQALRHVQPHRRRVHAARVRQVRLEPERVPMRPAVSGHRVHVHVSTNCQSLLTFQCHTPPVAIGRLSAVEDCQLPV